jgi:hypothetical protein
LGVSEIPVVLVLRHMSMKRRFPDEIKVDVEAAAVA